MRLSVCHDVNPTGQRNFHNFSKNRTNHFLALSHGGQKVHIQKENNFQRKTAGRITSVALARN
jgi:hypothetical protein